MGFTPAAPGLPDISHLPSGMRDQDWSGQGSAPTLCRGGDSPGGGGSEDIRGGELLTWRNQLLAEGGRVADLDWLLDLEGGISWQALQALRLHPERTLTLRSGRQRLADLWRRHQHSAEPLQYLVGRCPWRDLELTVAPGVLIPRQETELLIDFAFALLTTEEPCAPPPLWADLGTGSGCLAIALGLALPDSSGFAVEACPQAERLALVNLANMRLLGRVTLLAGDWWAPLEPWWGRLGLVVTNPPYIPSATVAGLDPVVRDHEPRQALDGGADGLAAIRRIVAGAHRALAPGGLLVMEHHHDQSPFVLDLLRGAGLHAVQAHCDLEGIPRFASARRRHDPPHP